jgi:hypothetical protein
VPRVRALTRELHSRNARDSYGASTAEGYNVPVMVAPTSGCARPVYLSARRADIELPRRFDGVREMRAARLGCGLRADRIVPDGHVVHRPILLKKPTHAVQRRQEGRDEPEL